jgi:8-oxo-dGTP pyrophosphatase MutT (NUDIX family)
MGHVTKADVTEPQLPRRLAGRVIAIDPAERVLLFHYQDPPPKGDHWATPGGGVEDGEDFYVAACRELAEETGWTDVPVGAREVHQETNVQWSNYRQTLIRQTDHYFAGLVPQEERPLGEVADMHVSDGILGHRWWTLAEIEAAGASIYPRGLAGLVRRIVR